MLFGCLMAIIKQPNNQIRAIILHFAAGVIFSVVSVEILPDVIKKHMPVMTVIGFAAGFLAMAAVRKLTEITERKSQPFFERIPWGILAGIGVDILMDGFLLGIGFTVGNSEGVLLAIALSIEFLSLGIATTTELISNRLKATKTILLIAGLAILFWCSALLGVTVLQNTSHNIIDVVLSFGLSALLFLVTEELLKEAHEQKETIGATSAFFGGFLLFLILGMYV